MKNFIDISDAIAILNQTADLLSNSNLQKILQEIKKIEATYQEERCRTDPLELMPLLLLPRTLLANTMRVTAMLFMFLADRLDP